MAYNAVFLDDELITAPLTDGIILPGVIRDSVLTLAREMNLYKVTERYVQISEIRKADREKRVLVFFFSTNFEINRMINMNKKPENGLKWHHFQLYEIFGTGTACVVSPVGKIVYRIKGTDNYEEILVPTMHHQPNIMRTLYDRIVGIQVINPKL